MAIEGRVFSVELHLCMRKYCRRESRAKIVALVKTKMQLVLRKISPWKWTNLQKMNVCQILNWNLNFWKIWGNPHTQNTTIIIKIVWSLFKKFENKCKNKHKVQIKLSKIQTCTTDLASYSLTQWQFWQLTLKWLSGARAQDKNKKYYYCFLFLLFLFNYANQEKFTAWNLAWNSLVRQWIFLS